jgi:hypothetical protein
MNSYETNDHSDDDDDDVLAAKEWACWSQQQHKAYATMIYGAS